MAFQKAVKTEAFLKLALCGPSSSGKSFSGLQIATKLADLERRVRGRGNGRVAAICTEHGSLKKYGAPLFDFDIMVLTKFGVEDYLSALVEAYRAGYASVLIDQISHEWAGSGGLLEQKDAKAASGKGSNNFNSWADITPQHNKFIDKILAYPGDVICTLRSKTDWAMEIDPRTGKTIPRKVGLAPVQRDGIEYEFDFFARMDQVDLTMTIDKTRMAGHKGRVYNLLEGGAEQLVNEVWEWLQGPEATQPAPALIDAQQSVDQPIPATPQPTPPLPPPPPPPPPPQPDVVIGQMMPPRDAPPPPDQIGDAADPLSAAQLQLIQILIRELGKSFGASQKAEIYERYKIKSSKELTMSQASELIQDLKDRIKEKNEGK